MIFQYALLSGGLLVGKDLTVLTERIELIPSRLISYDPSTNATVELVSGIAFVFWAYFYAFLLSADFFSKSSLSKKSFRHTVSVKQFRSRSDQRLSADNTSSQRINCLNH